jgi:GNAT superfamily N-acetyltransferase
VTIAMGGRPVVARSSSDRAVLRGFLERDRLFAAYAVCDLDEREFGRARWAVAMAGNHLLAVGMEYTGPTPQSMFVLGHNDGIAAILRDVLRPRAAYISVSTQALPAVAQSYRVEPGPQMVRMHVDRAGFRPYPAAVERLLPVEVGELNRLYQLGFAAWLPSGAVAEGVYFGIRAGGRLVAAAGTHVVSREARMGVVGNVMTHAEYRNRGFAKAVTSAVTAELLRYCDDVVLNVRADNPPAIAAYLALGYVEHCRFEERLIRRTAPAWAAIPGPFRRFFGPRQASADQLAYDQAHPIIAPADAQAAGPTAAADDRSVDQPPAPPAEAHDAPNAGAEPGPAPEEPR